MAKLKTLNALTNTTAGKRAWRSIAILLGLTTVSLSLTIVGLTKSMPVRLIPYGFDTAKGIVEATANGKNNLEYITHIALADIKLLTDWTPKTVSMQYRRFLNRLTPEARAVQLTHLNSKSEEIEKTAKAQVFFPSKTEAADGTHAVVEGRVQRWDGDEKMVDEKVIYKISYRYVHGVPFISEMETIDRNTTTEASGHEQS